MLTRWTTVAARVRTCAACFLTLHAASVQAGTYYWDAPNDKQWSATDNTGGATWWRVDATNGAYSMTLPSNNDTCYHIKATSMGGNTDFGSPGQYAVIHLDNGAILTMAYPPVAPTYHNPLVVESGGALYGVQNNRDHYWYGPILLNGALAVGGGRTMTLSSPLSGTGSVVYVSDGTQARLVGNYQNTYSGGTVIQAGRSVATSSATVPNDQDGFFGTGPVDMRNGASCTISKDPWNASLLRFLNNKTSFYGSSGGTNYLYNGDGTDWEISGSKVTWRPGPRDRRGLGVTCVAKVANLKCSGESATNGFPTLQIGMKLGGLSDRLLVSTNSGPKPNVRLNGQITLAPDNIETNQGGSKWMFQLDQKYVIAELNGATNDHRVFGTFANVHETVAGETYQRILFSSNFFKYAYITYQGDAGSGNISEGNDILLWHAVPLRSNLGTIVTLR